jgi:hypothetical protein
MRAIVKNGGFLDAVRHGSFRLHTKFLHILVLHRPVSRKRITDGMCRSDHMNDARIKLVAAPPSRASDHVVSSTSI